MIVNALIEIWPRVTAVYIHELPGIYTSGPDLDAALDILPDQVEQHLAWLNTHGAGIDTGDGIEIAIAEQLQAPDDGTGPLFEMDRQPLSSMEVERGVAVIRLAARDLVDLYRTLSDTRREQIRDAAGWSMADHLHHVARTNLAWVAAVSPPPTLTGDPVRDLLQSTSHVASALQAIDSQSWGTVHTHNDVQWTATRSLRRIAALLREHYPLLRTMASG